MKQTLYTLVLFLLASAVGLTSCNDDDELQQPQPQYIGAIALLRHLERVENVETTSSYDGDYYESYAFCYKVPVNHFPDDPQFPATHDSIPLRVNLHFKSFDAPTVLLYNGYDLKYEIPALPAYLGANILEVENRYYGESFPASYQPDPSWPYVCHRQNAADVHDVVAAFKPYFPGKWAATGTSKGGVETALYAYYYPGEMDLYVPFCAPFTLDLHDLSMGRWLNEGIATADIRQRFIALFKTCLHRQDTLLPLLRESRLKSWFENGYSLYALLEYRRFNWLGFSNAGRIDAALPRGEVSDEELVKLLCSNYLSEYQDWASTRSTTSSSGSDEPQVESFWRNRSSADSSDEELVSSYAYPAHALKEMGYFDYDPTPFQEEAAMGLLDPQEAVNDLGTKAEQAAITYSNSLHLDLLNRFLPQTTCCMVFVYGQYDPWTGAAIQHTTGTYHGNPHVDCIVIPECGHNCRFTNFSGPEVDRLRALIDEAMGR